MSIVSINMYSFLSLILIIFSMFNYLSLGSEIRDIELAYIKEFNSDLNFTSDINLFSNTRLNADLKQYTSGLENEDIRLNISQLVRKYGFNVEEHVLRTEDGYLLTIFRILGIRKTVNKGPVVFLMHGLLMSADDWVTAGPQTAIAYLLANEGYDVWLGNARGNKHSRRHEVMVPSLPDFWNFSWDEIGRYDLPAMIDYVLITSNQTELIYVGHSQGTTAFFVMCSELPEYNEKISVMVALAPATAIPKMKSPFLNFLKFVTLYRPELMFSLAKEMGFYEFLPSSNFIKTFGSNICGTEKFAEIVCSNVVFMICGFNPDQQNVTNLPVIFGHTPAGASLKQIEHYSQTVMTEKFRRFDYGEAQNLEIYGSKEPPQYPVEKITAPIALFYSDNDWLVSFEDVKVLRKRLPNVIDVYRVPLESFNHVDFLYAKGLKELVFEKLLTLLKEY